MNAERNLEVMRRFLSAFDGIEFVEVRDALERADLSGDLVAESESAGLGALYALAVDSLDPEFKLEFFTEQVLVQGQRVKGIPGFLRFWGDWMSAWDDYSLSGSDYEAIGEHVLVEVIHAGRGRGSGIEIELHQSQVWTFRDGKIIRNWIYDDRRQALASIEAD